MDEETKALAQLEQLGFTGAQQAQAKRLAGSPPMMAVYKVLQVAVGKKRMYPDEALLWAREEIGRLREKLGGPQPGDAPAETPAQGPAEGDAKND